MNTITMPTTFGAFVDVAQEAIKLAISHQEKVIFIFNGISIVVHPQSFINDICTIYDERCAYRRNLRY